MQGIKINGFYGISIPMLLAAPADSARDIISAASNGFSSRLLNNLYEEGKFLEDTLYHSQRFKYVIDESSKQSANLVKYADFSVAFMQHLEQFENTSNGLPEVGGITDGGTELPELKLDDLLGGSGIGELPGIDELGDIAGDTNLFSDDVEGLPEMGLDLDVELESLESPEDIIQGIVNTKKKPNLADIGLDLSSIDAELGDQPISLEAVESDGLDFVGVDLQSDEDSDDWNTRILNSLQYNVDFYNKFIAGEYQSVLPEIVNWTPVKLIELRSLKFGAQDLELLESKRVALHNVENTIKELSAGEQTELTRTRLRMFTAEVDTLRQTVSELEGKTKYFTETILNTIETEKEKLPRKLLPDYKTVQGTNATMSTMEYRIVSRLHAVCSRSVGDEKALDKLLNYIRDTRDRNVLNTPKFLNQEFSRLSTKDMPSQLILLNKQYRTFLDNYTGGDLSNICKQGITDCKVLLDTEDEDSKQLIDLFALDMKEAKQEMLDEDPKRYMLKGEGNVRYAAATIVKMPDMATKMSVGTYSVDETILSTMIFRLFDSSKMIELAKSKESLIALYKIFYFINKFTLDVVLLNLGIFFDTGENGETEKWTLDDWRDFTLKFGILGFYSFPQEMFDKCCDINVIVSNNKKSIIREKVKPNLYENIKIIERFLASKQVSLLSPYPFIQF